MSDGKEPKRGCCHRPYQFMALEGFAPEEKITAADVVEALKENTTSTGIPHIHHARGPIKKGCWFMITIGAVAGLIFNLFQLSTNYMSFNVNVNIDVSHELQMIFPSVTICNMSPVKRSALMAYRSGSVTSGPTGVSTTAAAPVRGKRAAGAGDPATTAANPTTATAGLSPSSACCCSCCFDLQLAGLNNSCNCGVNQFSYDASTCPAPKNALSSASTSPKTAFTSAAPTMTSLLTSTGTGVTAGTSLAAKSVTSSSSSASTSHRQSSTTPQSTSTTVGGQSTSTTVGGSTYADEMNIEQLLMDELATMPPDLQESLGFSVNDIFLDCAFEGFTCNPELFSHFFNEILGNCYIFNAGWIPTDNQMSKKTGRRHGLQLTLNVNQDEYVMQGDDTAGIRLVVHQRQRMPFPEDEGLALNPGEATSIGLRQLNILRESPPYDNCIDSSISNIMLNVYEELHPGVQYSSIACMRTCYQRNIITTCGCGDPGYPLYGLAFSLNASNPAPICGYYNITQQVCMTNISAQYSNNSLDCNCPNACSDISYVTGLSIGLWPSNVQKDIILASLQPKVNFNLTTNDNYKDNLIKVELYFESFDFELIQEVPAYLFTKFLSDSGGVLGLWLGMSVLTVFEFVEFGLDLAIIGSMTACSMMTRPRGNRVESVSIKPERSHSMISRPRSTTRLVDDISLGMEHRHAAPGLI